MVLSFVLIIFDSLYRSWRKKRVKRKRRDKNLRKRGGRESVSENGKGENGKGSEIKSARRRKRGRESGTVTEIRTVIEIETVIENENATRNENEQETIVKTGAAQGTTKKLSTFFSCKFMGVIYRKVVQLYIGILVQSSSGLMKGMCYFSERKAETGIESESGNVREKGKESGKGTEIEKGKEIKRRNEIERKMKRKLMNGESWKENCERKKLHIRR